MPGIALNLSQDVDRSFRHTCLSVHGMRLLIYKRLTWVNVLLLWYVSKGVGLNHCQSDKRRVFEVCELLASTCACSNLMLCGRERLVMKERDRAPHNLRAEPLVKMEISVFCLLCLFCLLAALSFSFRHWIASLYCFAHDACHCSNFGGMVIPFYVLLV